MTIIEVECDRWEADWFMGYSFYLLVVAKDGRLKVVCKGVTLCLYVITTGVNIAENGPAKCNSNYVVHIHHNGGIILLQYVQESILRKIIMYSLSEYCDASIYSLSEYVAGRG
jgi:hypothetical protein